MTMTEMTKQQETRNKKPRNEETRNEETQKRKNQKPRNEETQQQSPKALFRISEYLCNISEKCKISNFEFIFSVKRFGSSGKYV